MKDEKPIKVVKNTGKHKTETRIFSRDIHETFCIHPRCKFKNGHAQQGVCYSNKPDLIDWNKLDQEEKQLEAELTALRKKYSNKEYIEWLESMYVCVQMNWTGTLDEVIRLRRDNALLKKKK